MSCVDSNGFVLGYPQIFSYLFWLPEPAFVLQIFRTSRFRST